MPSSRLSFRLVETREVRPFTEAMGSHHILLELVLAQATALRQDSVRLLQVGRLHPPPFMLLPVQVLCLLRLLLRETSTLQLLHGSALHLLRFPLPARMAIHRHHLLSLPVLLPSVHLLPASRRHLQHSLPARLAFHRHRLHSHLPRRDSALRRPHTLLPLRGCRQRRLRTVRHHRSIVRLRPLSIRLLQPTVLPLQVCKARLPLRLIRRTTTPVCIILRMLPLIITETLWDIQRPLGRLGQLVRKRAIRLPHRGKGEFTSGNSCSQ